MGLSVQVGYLAELREVDEEGCNYFKEYFVKLNSWLVGKGLRKHDEPMELPEGHGFSCSMFGYSGLHTLRRVAAYLQVENRIPDGPMRTDSADEKVVNQFYKRFPRGASRFDHLMIHSDAEGFYLPQEFPTVLFPPEPLEIPGGIVGSSQRLLAECIVIANALELPPDEDPDSQELAELIEDENKRKSGWKYFPIESYTCLQLIGACRASISSEAAIVFT